MNPAQAAPSATVRRAPLTSSSLARRVVSLAAVLACTAAAFTTFSDPATDLPIDLEIESESPERGHYRLQAAATLEASPGQLLAMLTDFEQHCMADCRYPLPSLERIEVVRQEGESTITWTRVNDLMDAHYFTRGTVRREEGAIALDLVFLEEDELADLVTEARPHDPFFHQQSVAWTLVPGDSGTRVQVRMEMRSKKFLVNLMPTKVLEGSENYLEKVFGHLESIGSQPADLQSLELQDPDLDETGPEDSGAPNTPDVEVPEVEVPDVEVPDAEVSERAESGAQRG